MRQAAADLEEVTTAVAGWAMADPAEEEGSGKAAALGSTAAADSVAKEVTGSAAVETS